MSIFPGELIAKAAEIRAIYPNVAYDHRPFMTEHEPDFTWKQEEKFRVGYACLKWAVAKVLQPKTIREIGVGGGVAALAFLDACPDAAYCGIDNGQMGVERGFDFLTDVLNKMGNRQASIERQDSRLLSSCPTVDLVHIDGCHLFDWAYHDMRVAVASKSKWILVDDARDPVVASATIRAFLDWRQGPFEWCYYEDTWTGNLLFSQEICR